MKKTIIKPKILIIEDDIFIGSLLVSRLEKNGMSCILAADAAIALDKIKKEKPDLILLDIILPGMDGYELLAKLKADKDDAVIPVIILSNLGQEADTQKGLDLGAEDFLLKANLNVGDVIQKVRAILERNKNK